MFQCRRRARVWPTPRVYPEIAALSITHRVSGMCVAALWVSTFTKADAVSALRYIQSV